MHKSLAPTLAVAVACVVCAAPALAGRPVTDQERARLEVALKALGCTGGNFEFEDKMFEVEDAVCSDGKKYELYFDQAFAPIRKK